MVDDDDAMLEFLTDTLDSTGYRCTQVGDSLRALSYLAQKHEEVDLVLSDINMPRMSGIDLLQTVKAVSPSTPVVLISGQYEQTLAVDALKSGAAEYLYKPVSRAAVLEIVARHLGPGGGGEQETLQRTLGEYLAANRRPLSTEQVLTVFDALGFKRFETMQHSRRVAEFSLLLAREYRLAEERFEELRLGALLHDVGKIAIPHNILMKPGPLDDQEMSLMKLHPEIGWELLSPFPQLQGAAAVVLRHHERYDGAGYPGRLKGDSIPELARLFSAIDTLDAIISHRPYRDGRPIEVARQEIVTHSGSQFDPTIVAALERVSDDSLDDVRNRFPDEPPESESAS